MELTNCLNCNNSLETTQKFCGNCGQKARTHRLTLGHFFHEFFHAFTHADKGIFYLLKGLATRPGVVAREYIEGKRKKYFNPYTFFLIMMGIYVISNQFFSGGTIADHVPAGILKIPNEQAKVKAIAMFERGQDVRVFMGRNGNIVSMIAIPTIAFIFWLAYRKRKYNYAEHLTANLMFTTFANLAFTIIVFPWQYFAKGTSMEGGAVGVGLLLQMIYYSWAYTGLLQIKTFGGMAKTFLISLLGILVWTVLWMTLMAVYIYQSWDFYQFFVRIFDDR